MDLSNTDRAIGSKAQQVPRQRPLKRKTCAEPPGRKSSPPKKKKEQKQSSTVYYEIKGILSERKSGKATDFLIDWEDNPATGEVYEPTWEPYSNVTPAAIFEWENRRAVSEFQKSQSQHASSQDSESTRPAKRKRTNNPSWRAPVLLENERAQYPNTAVRKGTGSKITVPEIKDSYGDENSGSAAAASGPGGFLSVLISPNRDLNPNEYTVVRSSQCSDFSNSQANLPSSSPLKTQALPNSPTILPRKRSAPAFIWDEDIVPEPENSIGSNLYKSSNPRSASECEEDLQSVPVTLQPDVSERAQRDIARSNPEAISTQHSDTVTVATDEQLQRRDFDNNINQSEVFDKSPIPDSLRIESSLSLDLISTQAQAQAQSAPQESLTPKSHQHHRISQPLRYAASEEPSQVPPPVSNLSSISEFPILESQHNSNQLSQEAEQSNIQKSPSQPSLEIPDSYLVSDLSTQKSSQGVVDTHIGGQDRASSLPTNQSQTKTVLLDSQRSQSLPSALVFHSSPEETWQAAQIVSQISRTSSQELSPGTSQSQGSRNHVQVDNSQVSNSRHQNLDDYHNLSSSGDHRVESDRDAGVEIPETQPSALEVFAAAASPQVLASIESEADLHNGQLQYQELPSSQESTESASSGTSLSNTSPRLAVKMSTIAPIPSHLVVGERRARSTKSRSPSNIPPRVATAPPASSAIPPLLMRDSIADLSRSRNRRSSLPRASIEESASMNPEVLTMRKLGRNEFIVPLPMMSQIRDVYDTIIKNKKKDIMSFLGELAAPGSDSMDMMIEELKLICDHQDLIVEESSTQNLDDSAQARYAVTISTKFLFIQQLLDSLRASKVHVVIVARHAILPILEALFRSQQYSYNRPDVAVDDLSGDLRKPGNDSLKVTLLPTWIEIRDCNVAPASVVVAFDSSFSVSQGGDEYAQILPINPKNPDKRAPLLWLVTTNSAEHIELCIPTDLESSERKDRLIQYVALTRKVVGILDFDSYPDPQEAARRAAEYILDDSMEAEWPLNPMPDIEILSFVNGASHHRSSSLTQSLFTPVEPKPQIRFKRPSNFDAVDEDTASKRQRLTPVRQGREPESNIVNGSSISELEKTVNTLYARCEDYERSIERIRPKLQRALDERARSEHENAQVVKRQSEYNTNLELRDEAAAKLREENASLKTELAVAKKSLLTSEIPSVVELHEAKNDLLAAHAEIKRLKKTNASLEKRVDYATSLYQENSQQSQEMRNELTTLRSEREELERQASAARIEMNKIAHDGIIQQQIDTIDELRRELMEKERHLGVIAGQLDAYMNGRRTTRGTSVPRSPRMNNMSPRPRGYSNMAPGSNAASRGNSPTPGVLGGDLFQGGEAGRRFGAHLQ